MLQSNALLKQVVSRGLDGYDEDASAAPKWQGSTEAYLVQKTARVTTGEGSEPERRWTIYVPVSLNIAWAIDDEVTIEWKSRGYMVGGSTVTVPIISIDVRDDPEMPDDVCTVALTVEPAAP